MLKLGFIGAGTVGTALAFRLNRQGYQISAVASRSRDSAVRFLQTVGSGKIYHDPQSVADNADFVFLTTPDDAIPDIVETVRWHSGQYLVHCSGADSVDVLEPARMVGALVGSFHPLQTFASIQKAIDNLPGSTFALEADGSLFDILKEMALSLNGQWIKLGAGDKAAYHAAAVMTSNYLVTLIKLATDLWGSFGIPREQALHALMPLLKGTVNNLENLGLPKALTGPIARGDIGTVQIHLRALNDSAPGVIPAYCEMGLQTVPIAVAKGKINQSQAYQLTNMLNVSLKSNIEREDKCAPC
jgi:predicted short-subunit dehydrogenase-like oxidoreductase (DUF2520 family)